MVNNQKQTQLFTEPQIRYASVRLSEVVKRGKRFEAGYYDIDSKRIRELIRNNKYKIKPLLGENGFVKEAFYPTRFKRIYVAEGIPFLSSSEILENRPRPKHLSVPNHKDQTDLYVQENWILISRSGTVGNSVYSAGQFKDCAISEHVIRLIPHNPKDAPYVYAFLRTRFAQTLLFGLKFGSVIIEIDPEHLSEIELPDPPADIKEGIASRVRQAAKLRIEANSLLDKADALLYEKLDIKLLKYIKPRYFAENGLRNYEVKASKLELRLEANYHLPIVTEIKKQILKNNPKPLKSLAKCFMLPTYKRIYLEEGRGLPVLSGAQILEYDPSDVKYISPLVFRKKVDEYKIKENWILVTGRGTVGNCMLVPKHFNDWLASHNIDRVIPHDESKAGYIFAFLSSDYGRAWLQSKKLGSVVDVLTGEDLGEILIPMTNEKDMKLIGDLVFEANRKRTDAYYLEKEAINEVDKILVNKVD